MLEPPAPAVSAFQTEQEAAQIQDFEQVCISLVERGWKIMPKKGTYPLNKSGPRYVNLVDPRGNRKTIHVFDEKLWEKLRDLALERKLIANNKEGKGRQRKEKLLNSDSTQPDPVAGQVEPISQTEIESQKGPESVRSEETGKIRSNQVLENNSEINENPKISSVSNSQPIPSKIDEESQKDQAIEESLIDSDVKTLIESNQILQQSVYELGLEILLDSLDSIALTSEEIRRNASLWADSPKMLSDFVRQNHRSVSSQISEATEKEVEIESLRSNLKNAQTELVEIKRRVRELSEF